MTDILPLVEYHNQWRDTAGGYITLCVLHKLGPEQKEEAPAVGVVGGMSLCPEHLDMAIGFLMAGYSPEALMEMQFNGELEEFYQKTLQLVEEQQND